jgi:hypothetical protein
MALKPSRKYRPKIKTLSKSGLAEIEAAFSMTAGPVAAFEADRAAHLRARPCVVDECDHAVPCPDHGTPAEDRGDWLWGGRS